MPRSRFACLLAGLLGLACVAEQPAGPDFEWQGEWIDIWGIGKQPEDTCAGTFAYLDGFADAISSEFGVDAHLGVYRWYSHERFDEYDPCRNPGLGCAGLNGAFTYFMPFEHEVVHLANIQSFPCPRLLSEGLAEYYSPNSETPTSGDIQSLLEGPTTSLAGSDYPIAGAFVAYLVETYGHDALLEICRLTGPAPTAELLAETMTSTFGVPLEQVIDDFGFWEDIYACEYSQYRAKLYECGQPPATVLERQTVTLDVTLDCNDARTIGPRDQEIWTLVNFRVAAEGSTTYEISLKDDTGAYIDEVGFELIECAACGDGPRWVKQDPDPELSGLWVSYLFPGDYFIKLWGPPEFVGNMTLTFSVAP